MNTYFPVKMHIEYLVPSAYGEDSISESAQNKCLNELDSLT